MILRDILSRDTPGNLEDISSRNKDYLIRMVEVMNNQDTISPQLFYRTWVKKTVQSVRNVLIKGLFY